MSFLPASSHGCHMFGVVRTGAAASMRRGGGGARRGTRRGYRRGSRHGTRRGTRRAAGEWRTCMPECRSALYGGAHGKPVPVPQNAAYAAPRRAALLAPHTYDLSLSLFPMRAHSIIHGTTARRISTVHCKFCKKRPVMVWRVFSFLLIPWKAIN